MIEEGCGSIASLANGLSQSVCPASSAGWFAAIHFPQRGAHPEEPERLRESNQPGVYGKAVEFLKRVVG